MSSEPNEYSIKKYVPYTFDEAVSKVTEKLKDEGFGVLTEIDVKATLKQKIDEDFTEYVILGACNPRLAIQALNTELDIGLLLPCNVVVYNDKTREDITVSAVDPVEMLKISGREDLHAFAAEVKERLQKALDNL